MQQLKLPIWTAFQIHSAIKAHVQYSVAIKANKKPDKIHKDLWQ